MSASATITGLCRSAARRAAALGCCLAIMACSSPDRLSAVPKDLEMRAEVPGLRDIRYFAPQHGQAAVADAVEALRREHAALAANGHRGPLPPMSFLAISGGGEDDAFGAGLLVGWSAHGTRPQFKVVTGVSTGALTAPFAFLGPAYDEQLKSIYTRITSKDIFESRWFLAALLEDAMSDTAPLRRTVAKFLDDEMVRAIAEENRKGRLLLVATTNLDGQRGVVWNITKIAASGHPRATAVIRDILVASAAVPGVFPPVMIDVEVDGRRYHEMHVDGGASMQVFTYPPGLDREGHAVTRGIAREKRMYVIRNGRLDSDLVQVERRVLSIAGRSISSLIQNQGVGDLYRIYVTSQRDGMDFNLAFIPRSFNTPLKEPFDSQYMNALYKVGYDLAVSGYRWHKTPPDVAVPGAAR
jgi:hypothetical protein